MKIAVIGAGNVGGTLAQRIVEANFADVVLVDIAAGFAAGKSLDLLDARPLLGTEYGIVGTNDFAQIAGADIVVITAGLPRQPGMTREDLLKKNAGIVGEVVDAVKRYAPQALLLLVTNPLDVMTAYALKRSGFSPERVIGMGGVLDSARFANLVAEALRVPPAQVQAMVIGAHGQEMIPLTRLCTVGGVPLPDLLSKEQIAAIAKRTVERGAEIVNLLGKGSAFYAPSAAAFRMVKIMATDQATIVPACAFVDGAYGLHKACIGVPVLLSGSGVEKIIELALDKKELKQLQAAADTVRAALEQL
ncbi:MAG: malate dehydrogenase [Candidatus Omnitrophica bacterium]|nr:malate dehydrogenase [Candidatus Omnitrophota bacterium]